MDYTKKEYQFSDGKYTQICANEHDFGVWKTVLNNNKKTKYQVRLCKKCLMLETRIKKED